MNRIWLREFAVSALVLFLFLGTMLGQNVTGRLVGNVNDSTGAVVVGVKVQAHNTATNFTATTVTGSNGAFTFESLQAGTYNVTAQQPGFSSYEAHGVQIESQNTATLKVLLKVGSQNQTVEVSDVANAVDTENASIQSTIGPKTLDSLPVASSGAQRSVINVVQQVQPGAVSGSNGQFSFNGGRTTTNNYKLDGSDVNDYFNAFNTENPAFPAQENLSEVSVITEAIDAKYGNSGGAQITATIKSGTNDLHGIIWGYFQNQAWNANSWTANHFRQPRAPGSQHWIGGNIGGPVLIPKLYNGHNKTFFFFSYERTTPTAFNTATFLVPSAAERAGDFTSQETGAIKAGYNPIVDPGTFSPLGKAILMNNLLPLPNSQGQMFSWNWNLTQTTDNYIVKIDQQFGQKNHLSGSYTHLFQNPVSNNYGSCCGGGFENIPPGYSTLLNPHHIYSLYFQDIYTVTPNLVNTLSVGGGHTLVTVTRGNQNSNFSWPNLGVTGITPDTGATNLDAQVSISPGFILWGGYIDTRNGDTTNISDDASWIHGRNNVEFGYSERLRHDTKGGTYDAAGEIDYNTGYGGSSGNSFYDLFTDTGAIFNQSSTQNFAHSYPQHTAYAQDTIKVLPRLTATVGLRWDPNEGYREDHNKFSIYRPGVQSVVYPTAPVGQIFYGDPGVNRPGYAPTWTNFNPRIGLAYDLTGKGTLAVRAGFGAFSDFTTLQGIADNLGYPFQADVPPFSHPLITGVSLG